MRTDGKTRSPRPRRPESLSDWLLGGRARRAVFERLAEENAAWKAEELAIALEVSRPWVFEIFRVLKPTGALDQVGQGRYRLAEDHPLSDALREMTIVAGNYADVVVERPPRRKPS
jgi:hypothetical protein